MDSRRSIRSIWITVLVVALLMAGAVGWNLWTRRPVQQAAPAAAATPEATAPPAPSMPSLQQADATVQSAAAGLSTSAKFKEWLGVGDLARKLVATINNVADGASPRAVLAFLAPDGAFRTEQSQGRLYIDPGSYARYDEVASVIDSIDAKAAAGAYQTLHPLLSTAYGEIGRPGTTLDERLQAAIQRLVATPELPERTEVRPAATGILYQFTEARLEALSPASKHLLRMGPKNERLIQAKLRALATELHLPPVAAAASDTVPPG